MLKDPLEKKIPRKPKNTRTPVLTMPQLKLLMESARL
jgi:hypothetical protein